MRKRQLMKFYKLQKFKNEEQSKIIQRLNEWIPSYYITKYSKDWYLLPEWVKDEDIAYKIEDKKQGIYVILVK